MIFHYLFNIYLPFITLLPVKYREISVK